MAEKKKFVVVWESTESGGATKQHSAIIEAEDDPKGILKALRDYGLCWELGFGVSIYEISKGYDSRNLLKSLGFEGDKVEIDTFLKQLCSGE